MVDNISEYKPQHEYLICLDSDGTVIDAMNVKHNYCHGPAFIEEWGLEEHREEVQKLWNQINLFNRTRGINRFLAVKEILKLLDGKLLEVEGLEHLENWVNNTKELSASSLKKEIEKNDAEILKKAMRFSIAVNQKIAALSPVNKPPFEGLVEALEYAKDKVDIAIVSSSNMAAIKEEWGYYDLLKYPSVITSLEMGTKKECIEKIIAQGVDPKKILMCGDAMPDVDSAKATGVYFFPVLINNEKKSWTDFKDKYLDEFIAGNFEKYQEEVLEQFENNFGTI